MSVAGRADPATKSQSKAGGNPVDQLTNDEFQIAARRVGQGGPRAAATRRSRRGRRVGSRKGLTQPTSSAFLWSMEQASRNRFAALAGRTPDLDG